MAGHAGIDRSRQLRDREGLLDVAAQLPCINQVSQDVQVVEVTRGGQKEVLLHGWPLPNRAWRCQATGQKRGEKTTIFQDVKSEVACASLSHGVIDDVDGTRCKHRVPGLAKTLVLKAVCFVTV